jgi:hypothetical protein
MGYTVAAEADDQVYGGARTRCGWPYLCIGVLMVVGFRPLNRCVRVDGMVSSYGRRHLAGDSWIPVERRWFGLDRRSLLPGLVVFAIAILLRGIIPLIDQAVPGHDVVRAGDRLNLERGLTVAPPVGWQLTDGILVGASTVLPGEGSPSAGVAQDGVSAQILVAPFTGDANALLDQINRNDSRSGNRPGFTVNGNRGEVTATGGIAGVVEDYTSTSADGTVAAYTFPDGRGRAIEVTGVGSQLSAYTGQISAMLRSVSLEAQP